MKKNKETIFLIIAILGLILFGTALAPIGLQNDTFYTIAIGQYIMENGISEYDPFSWHEALPYTFPHWLYDVTIGAIYNVGGMFGIYLSTVGLTVALGIVWFLVNCKLHKNKLTSFILAMALIYLMSPYIAARAQLFTFILFILEIYFIEMFLQDKKKRYAIGLIIIPIILANVHLAVFPFYFVLYLPYVGEYVMAIIARLPNYIRKWRIHRIDKKLRKGKLSEEQKTKIENKAEILQNKMILSDEQREKRKQKAYKLIVEKNDNVKWLILIMVICLFTGLLTPLGDTPYTYLTKTLDGNTTKFINEHLPIVIMESKPQLCMIVLILTILIFTDMKIRLKDLFMLGGLLLLALMSRRQMSMFVMIGLIILNGLIVALANKYDKGGSEKFIQSMQKPIGILATLLVVLIISGYFIKDKANDKFISYASYPVEACNYIVENLNTENMKIYNEYNYGSYLIYRGIPVFIDSRADLYTPEFDEEQKRDIFSDFLNINGLSKDYETAFEGYGITHVLIPTGATMNKFLSKDENYKELYSDNYFVLYERLSVE